MHWLVYQSQFRDSHGECDGAPLIRSPSRERLRSVYRPDQRRALRPRMTLARGAELFLIGCRIAQFPYITANLHQELVYVILYKF